MPREPPLFEIHEETGASFTEFGGWQMPVEFDSIRTEHAAVRESVGKFDVSHMGEIVVSGPDAAELTDRLVTNDVASLDPGGAVYAAITDEDGIMLDDTVVYCRSDEEYLFVPNAGHDEEATDRWETHRDEWGLDATVDNVTGEYGLIAVQGPEAVELLEDHCSSPGEIERFDAANREVAGVECLLARTGYTGEDGFEVFLDAGEIETVWNALDCQPCGLGARDTLRLEAGFLLSGQDFDPEENPRNPYEAGIDFAVDLDGQFVGRDALRAVAESGPRERFVGFRMLDRGIARHGYDVEIDGSVVGTVTSGTMSPTLGAAIALGYLPVEHAEVGTEVEIQVRGNNKKAVVEALPFYEP
ncbi:MAG: glycine cleavage system aminomethyltransferase GcvT [Natronomonas sp.]